MSGNVQTPYAGNISPGTTTAITRVPAGTDISGPSVSGAYVAWAADSGKGSRVFTRNLNVRRGRATHVVAQSVPNADLISRSVYGNHIAWIVEHRTMQYTSKVLCAPLSGANPRAIWSVSSTIGSGQILRGHLGDPLADRHQRLAFGRQPRLGGGPNALAPPPHQMGVGCRCGSHAARRNSWQR